MSQSLLGIAILALAAGGWTAWVLRRAGAAAAMVAGVGVPAASLALYLVLGTPQLSDQPLVSRDDPTIRENRELNQFREVTGELAKRLREQPENLQGWVMLTRAYRTLGEWDFASEAWQRALGVMGKDASAEDWANLALLRIKATDGQVDPTAVEAIERALTLDPQQPQALHYRALHLAQSGDLAGAIALWRALLADAPALAKWRPTVEQYLKVAEQNLARPQSGPSASDMASAAQMSDEERSTMIQGMVDQLAARLEETPDDPAGWLRLARAYGVLGRKEDAIAALGRAEETAKARLVLAAPEDSAEMRVILDTVATMRSQL
jgi:cytochrome c-type biogenesis protein CcmH